MKIKTTNSVPQQVEIEVPFFFKINYETLPPDYYVILDSNLSLAISDGSIVRHDTSSVYGITMNPKFERCSPEEFTREYDKVLNILQRHKSLFFKT